MKFANVKDLSVQELVKKRDELRAEVFHARMKNSLGQLANPVQIRILRKDLARLETALTGQRQKQ
ncbi:MAG: 50S ribosomal protein L29 [Bdellovibrio sp.]|nr:MAG: 50S ribosomal protein L29 [Bdellovibrio sp.]